MGLSIFFRPCIIVIFFLCCGFIPVLRGATFTLTNNCGYTVWPGILSNAGSMQLGSSGFELGQKNSRSFTAPTAWSGRIWARTGCNFSTSGIGSCDTADCGTGQLECKGNGANTPVTLAEFTLASAGGLDFYDVSLVDGFNLPMVISGTGKSGDCPTTGCTVDLNKMCPDELRAEGGGGCKSACAAFGKPEYCCSGTFSSPNTCTPTSYSKSFKEACPTSYSYAYDDATSTFTCSATDYQITFCAASSPSLKSSKAIPTPETATSSSTATPSVTNPAPSTRSAPQTADTSTENEPAAVILADNSYLASLATADASRTASCHKFTFTAFISVAFFLSVFHIFFQ